MYITKLMLHPMAAEMTAAIPGNADVTALADTYSKLISHGDYQSHCQALAIEFHIRTAAQVGFSDTKILQAVSTLEAALKTRQRAHRRILNAR